MTIFVVVITDLLSKESMKQYFLSSEIRVPESDVKNGRRQAGWNDIVKDRQNESIVFGHRQWQFNSCSKQGQITNHNSEICISDKFARQMHNLCCNGHCEHVININKVSKMLKNFSKVKMMVILLKYLITHGTEKLFQAMLIQGTIPEPMLFGTVTPIP